MKLFEFVLVTSVLFVVSCASTNKLGEVGKSDNEVNRNTAQGDVHYQSAVDQAFEELRAINERAPAVANSNFSLEQLRKVSPGKFKVFVFPKNSGASSKSKTESEFIYKNESEERLSRLLKPTEYEVSPVAISSCDQFINKNLFGNKFKAKAFFEPQLAEPKTRQCGIVEITSMKIKNANRALLKRDDVLMVRLYVDDAFNIHGFEMEKFDKAKNIQTFGVKSSKQQVSSSGLTAFPIDIPNLSILMSTSAQNKILDISKKIDRVALRQIHKKFDRGFAAKDCQGVQTNYKDYFGLETEVGWCQGLPFPQYMENSRFFAITQPISVR